MEIRDRRCGFLWINNEIIDDYATQLGPTALLVYMYLCRYAHNETGRCWPKQDALAEFCRVSDRSIRKAVSVLKSTGLISVELGSIGGSGYRSNIYTLLETVGSGAQTVGNKLPMVCETVGSERPKPQEATDTLTRLIEQDLINLNTPNPSSKKKSIKTEWPEGLQPNDTNKQLANELGVDLRAEWPAFREFHMSKGNSFKDWHLAANTWIRNSVKFSKIGQPKKEVPLFVGTW